MNGFSFIVTTASLKHEGYLKSLGATHVIDRHRTSEEVLAELEKIVGGTPVMFSYDSQGDKASQYLAYDALSRGGGMVCVQPRQSQLEGKAKPEDEKTVAAPFASFQLPCNRDLGLEVYKRLTDWIKDGTIVVRAPSLRLRLGLFPDGFFCPAEQGGSTPERPFRHRRWSGPHEGGQC